jgi:sulfoxide reductase heme-binding subunit YedZ
MTIWMTARGAGLSALILLTLSTGLGALASRRSAVSASNRVVLQYMHRTAGALGIGVLIVHIATILADSYAHVGVSGAIVPFTSSYRATWVGLGSLAAYCLVLVSAIGFARGRLAGSPLGARLWRSIHAFAYGAWALAIGHGFMSGTDSSVTWVRVLYVACLVSVAGCVWARLASRPSSTDRPMPRVLVNSAGGSR